MDETSRAVTAESSAPSDSASHPQSPSSGPEPAADTVELSPPEPRSVPASGSPLELYGERRLDPQYVPFQRAVGWILTASASICALVGLTVIWLSNDLTLLASLLLIPVWILVTAGIGWLFYTWPAVHYRHVSYTLDAEGIEIRTGVWWREVMSVPRSRVQHIDVSQGPMERSYGLGRLVLYTAGTAHSRVELQGLSYAVAFALRPHLLPRGSEDAV